MKNVQIKEVPMLDLVLQDLEFVVLVSSQKIGSSWRISVLKFLEINAYFQMIFIRIIPQM